VTVCIARFRPVSSGPFPLILLVLLFAACGYDVRDVNEKTDVGNRNMSIGVNESDLARCAFATAEACADRADTHAGFPPGCCDYEDDCGMSAFAVARFWDYFK
jgi:hypothetical protein